MKKTFITIAFVCSASICSNIYAQQVSPTVSGDKDLRDTNVKSRSIDLERVDRDARKKESVMTNQAATNAEDKLAAKYAEIKTDYEQIQLSQDAVIKAYQNSGKIDYAQIGKSAAEINKSAVRLDSNLFPSPAIVNSEVKSAAKKEVGKEEITDKENKPTKSVRDLIVELDNAVGRFATSPMFQNLRVVDAAVSEKAKADLEKIIELSALLDAETRKMAANGN
ncbi:MAG TPA: hypothetical protein VF692_02710 [Pyrinomonadaceae bacterium]|jgi:hypothetical protein